MRIIKRLDPFHSNEGRCNTEMNCPAVFELEGGDLAFIGVDSTDQLRGDLPPGSGIGEGERLVVLPRSVLVSAGWTLSNPEALRAED
jgi:hypothetical protein